MRNIIKILAVIITICFAAFNEAKAADVFRVLDANNGLTDNQVQHILQLPDGRLIVTTLGNINIYDGAHFNYIHKKENHFFNLTDYKGAYHVYAGKDDILWVKNYHSLACFDLKKMQYINDINQLFRKMGIKSQVRDIFLDSDKKVWVVTPEGVLSVGSSNLYIMPANAGNLQDIEVEKGRLYMFFETGEIVCYDCSSTKMLYRLAAYSTSEKSLYSSTSLVVKGYNDDSFYQLRTGKRSIFLIFDTKKKRWHTILKTPYLLHTIVITRDHQAYITCAKGYWKFNLSNGKGQLITQLHTDAGESIKDAGLNTVFCDSQDGIWIGTYNRGLLYIHPSTYRFSSYYTGEGYDKRDNSHVTYHGKDYNMIIKDRRGWIWGGTNDGLNLIMPKEKKQRFIYTDDGLVNNFIHSIVEDNKGDIWVATSCGISRIKITQKNERLSFTNFTKQDGTLEGEYCNGIGKLLKDGRILMGGIYGFTLFHPDSVTSPKITLNPILTNILIHGEAINTSPSYVNHLNLNYHQNTLTFEFSALNFVTPKYTIYRYRLVGGDDKWHATRTEKPNGLDDKGLLHLSFVNLPYGKYDLQVMATTVPEEWGGSISHVTFTINAPWWQSSIAYLIYIVIVISLIILGIFVYLQMMRRRILQKQKEETLLQRIQDLIKQVDYEQNESDKTKKSNSNEEFIPYDAGNGRERMRNEDAEFVRKAAFLVESHINEQGYSVSELSRDLCMERTGLYKKLTALIDESPTLFIRHIRLQKAAEMLSEGKLSISDIAFRTGFSSSSYLSKCFQEEFGCKPSEYHK